MKDKPILFNTEMVKALLAGRKVHTRRVIKPQPDCFTGSVKLINKCLYNYDFGGYKRPVKPVKQPYSVGDRLWVRETWIPLYKMVNGGIKQITDYYEPDGFQYRADDDSECYNGHWKPSLFMPREAARLFLRVTAVRAEKLHAITDMDILKEGLQIGPIPLRDQWITLWDSINKKRGYEWDLNPYVWVIEFERIK